MTSRLPLFALAAALALGLAAGPAGEAQAAGCLKGAIVGGIAGHYAGHHFIAGAIGGCIVGHHMAAVNAREAEGAAGRSRRRRRRRPPRRNSSPQALLLSARSAFGSSGQRGRAGAARSSTRPRRSRSMPAQAIIAPLSVHSLHRRRDQRQPGLRAEARHRLADRAVGGDAAGDDDRLRGADPLAKQPEPDPQPILDHVDDRRLERGAEVGDVARL